jgi:hypothetical protein
MMKTFVHKTEIPKTKLKFKVEKKAKRKKEEKKEKKKVEIQFKRRENKKEEKKDQKSYITRLFENFHKEEPIVEEKDLEASDDEEWKEILEEENRKKEERRRQEERYQDHNNKDPDKDKIKYYLESIGSYGNKNPKRTYELLKKILTALLNDEVEKYKVLERGDEDIGEIIYSMEDSVKLLRVIGYNAKWDKLELISPKKDLLKHAIDLVEKSIINPPTPFFY